jgi:cytochrome c oxidase subunit II
MRATTAAMSILVGASCSGPFPQSTFSRGSGYAGNLSDLFMLIFLLAVVVFLLVQGALLYTLIRFRARPGAPDPKPVHGHTALEIGWTLAPAFIVSLILFPTVSRIWQDALADVDDPLEVVVVGHQWWWEFQIPELGVVTANELHLPQGRAVVLTMTSADVIHSFWAPGLAGKRDVILGRTTRLAFTPDSTGEYLGQCAEFCGTSHANMRLRVYVDAPPEFDAWVAVQTAGTLPLDSLSDLERQGYEVFRTPKAPPVNSCIACHAISGVSFGVAGPNLTHLADRETIAGGLVANTAENLERWLRDPAAVKPGMGNRMNSGQLIGMPDVDLTDQEITALVAYLRTLR